MIGIRPESREDYELIDELLTETFGQPDEAAIMRRLRETPDLILSLVAESHGELIGHVAFSRALAVSEADILHLACLAPMAVKPSKQRKGIGAALIRRGLEMIRELRFPGVVLVGQPEYYARFGFSAANAAALECPYSGPYLQALELTSRAVRDLGRASLKLAGPLMPGE